MLAVAAGAPLIELVCLCRAAGQPLLLQGKHGTGKSDSFAEAARQLDIDLIELDLSLLEPPDLIGIPRVESDGRTHYAPPSFLPAGGNGLLVVEELNRAPRHMQAPCLQLLTARRLNDFELPAGWLPCAAINDQADGYLVEELDEALLSRFLRVKVVPDVNEWLRWAQQHDVHERVRAFIQNSPGVFDDAAANPRAWTYASRLLVEWERGERKQDLLAVALGGVLGERWALAFIQHYADEHRPLQADEVIDSYPAHQASLRNWVGSGHLDAVAASVELLKRHVQSQRVYDGVVRDAAKRTNVESFIRDLPGDLRRQLCDWLKERGFKELAAVARRQRATP